MILTGKEKKEKIKEAYGEYWDQLRDSAKFSAITNNGWLHYNEITNNNGTLLDCIQMDILHDIDCYRPKSLQGIENNNGWIKIESEADLPENFKNVYCLDKHGNMFICESRTSHFFCHSNKWLYNYYDFTHYQTIEKPKPPIY